MCWSWGCCGRDAFIRCGNPISFSPPLPLLVVDIAHPLQQSKTKAKCIHHPSLSVRLSWAWQPLPRQQWERCVATRSKSFPPVHLQHNTTDPSTPVPTNPAAPRPWPPSPPPVKPTATSRSRRHANAARSAKSPAATRASARATISTTCTIPCSTR